MLYRWNTLVNAWQGTVREGQKKKKNLLSSNDISIFFHKFAISLKGQCKLGLLTNELLGQDMKFQ